MVEAPAARLWIGRLTWLVLAMILIFLQLLPLETEPKSWAPPDLLLAITMVWATRRPDFLPVMLVAIVFLGTDLLFQRPPGLWAAVVVLLTEWLRRRSSALRNATFPLEWGTVSIGIVGAMAAYRLMLAISMTPQAPLPLTVVQTLLTILSYPILVGIAALAFGVSRPAPGEVDSLGHRI